MKKILVLVILMCITFIIDGADKLDLTIDQAMKMALTNNTQYLISQQGVRQSRQRLKQNMGFLPTVSLQGAKNLKEKLMEIEIPSFIPGGEPTKATLDFTMDYEFSFQIVQPVFTGGKIWNSFKNAQIDMRIAKEREKNARQEVILNTKKMFFNIQVMGQLLKAHQEAIKLAENNLQNVKERYDLGMVSKYDLLRAELAVASIEPTILQVKKTINILKLNLKTFLGIPEQQEINLSGDLTFKKRTLDRARLLRHSLLNRSEIKQLKLEQKKANNLLKIAYAQFIPDFSIIATYSYRSNTFKLSGDNWENYYTINLGVNFPIFTGLKRSGQIGELKVMNKILRLNHKQLNDATRVEVQNLYLTVQQEYQNIQTGIKNVETAKEGIRIAELNYREGMISILELNASYNALTRARVAYLQAVYNYNIALAELEKVTSLNITGGKS